MKKLRKLSLALLILFSATIFVLLIQSIKAADIFAYNGVPEMAGVITDHTNSTMYLSFERRVACQKEIEKIFYQHRTWNNKTEKPAFEKAVSEEIFKNKAIEVLQKTNALKP